RPGGNATGLSIVATDLSGKRLQLLKEIVPGLSSIAVMSHGANPQSQMELRETQIAAQKLDLQVRSLPISADSSIENEQPTKFELSITPKTARMLVHPIPPTLLPLADEVMD